MARFLAEIEGSGQSVTRLVSPNSGIRASARGLDIGVSVYGEATDDGDTFTIWTNGGSNDSSTREIIGVVYLDNGRHVFVAGARRIPNAEARALELGRERGHDAGTWVIDGNTSAEEARRIVKGYEDGDPLVMDMAPEPLSGEWAGSTIPQTLADELDIDDYDMLQSCCGAFEQGFEEAYWAEVMRSAQAIL